MSASNNDNMSVTHGAMCTLISLFLCLRNDVTFVTACLFFILLFCKPINHSLLQLLVKPESVGSA